MGFCRFGSTRSQVRILSPRLVTARVLGNTGNPFFLSARESARGQGVSGLALLTCGHRSVVAGVRTIRHEMGQSPSFSCISCKPSPMCSPAAEQQAPLGYGRQRPSFTVPRLRRDVHRPAAAALRALAQGHGLGGWPGLWPAAAVARRILAAAGRGSARSGLARLRGRLHLQGLICLGWPLALAWRLGGQRHMQNRCTRTDYGAFSPLVLVE